MQIAVHRPAACVEAPVRQMAREGLGAGAPVSSGIAQTRTDCWEIVKEDRQKKSCPPAEGWGNLTGMRPDPGRCVPELDYSHTVRAPAVLQYAQPAKLVLETLQQPKGH